MTTIIVVEPYSLLRLGILRSLDVLAPTILSEAMDYSHLFRDEPKIGSTDLIVLSVPNKKERTIELVNAAERAFAPKSILLLSDVSALTYMVPDMSSILSGCMAKNSSSDMLVAAVRLILAGGKCFQPATLPPQTPALRFSAATPVSGSSYVAALADGDTPRRRWYDKNLPPPVDVSPIDAVQEHVGLLTETVACEPKVIECEPDQTPYPSEQNSSRSSLVASEAAMLKLTPRQYEVLVLLARGYPMKTVSRQLNISVATAKTHTVTLYQRLQVHTRNAAVYAAVSRGATLGWKGKGLGLSGSPAPMRGATVSVERRLDC
ncbi:MAG: LuxR C-terminal-related transcriptional regulator [Paralcaligenes sp.]